MSAPLRHALLVASLALCALLLRPATDAVAVALHVAPGPLEVAQPSVAPTPLSPVDTGIELVALSPAR